MFSDAYNDNRAVAYVFSDEVLGYYMGMWVRLAITALNTCIGYEDKNNYKSSPWLNVIRLAIHVRYMSIYTSDP